MSEVEEKQINEKTEKTEKAKRAKNRTSLKNIIGGDILATDFFRRQTKLLVLIMVLIMISVMAVVGTFLVNSVTTYNN